MPFPKRDHKGGSTPDFRSHTLLHTNYMLTDHTLVQPTPANNEDILLSYDVPNAGAWDTFVKSHPQGSPFHLMAWQRLIRDTFGSEPKHIVAHDARNGEICGVLPLFLVRSLLFGRMLLSTPQ